MSDKTITTVHPQTTDQNYELFMRMAKSLALISNPTSGVIGSAQTAATGASWTALSSQACFECLILNNTGTTIEIRRGGAGTGLPIPSGNAYTFRGITNANQLSIRRVDTSNTQVTVYYEALA
jgi:hypothetical protein